MHYSGIDLHSNNSVVTVTDDNDRVVAEKRLPNVLAKIIGFLLPWREELAGVVVESTYNWYWLVDGLQAAGFLVHLANTGAIKKYDGLKHSGDEADARQLAHLLRLGILPTGTILPPEHRAIRDLARKRMQRVRSRTSHILAIENIMARQQAVKISSNAIKRLMADDVEQMGLPADVGLAVQSNLAVITTLGAQIDLLEKRLQERVGERPDYALLTSVPGIGRILATIILLETGPIDRFAAVGNFASYARCVDSQHTSNGKKKWRGQYQERQQVFGISICRSGQLCAAFLPRGQAFLRAQENQNEHRSGDQGAGPQAGASLLPHSEGEQTL